jgi:phosphohistidine phosphatase SixA
VRQEKQGRTTGTGAVLGANSSDFIATLPRIASASLKYALSTLTLGCIRVVPFMSGRIAVVYLGFAVLAASLIAAPMVAVADERDAWAALANGGHVALIRHGDAPPGYGDPPGFKIDDCTTQRNMDEHGRAQARAVGEAFRQHRVPVDKILSSPLCRCLETARLAALGPVESVMAVASSDRSPERLPLLKQMVADWHGPGTLVLVTHAFTIRALVGIMPEQAEIVVLRPKLDGVGIEVVGRISAPR